MAHLNATAELDAMLAAGGIEGREATTPSMPVETAWSDRTDIQWSERAAARRQRSIAARAMPVWQQAFDLPQQTRAKATPPSVKTLRLLRSLTSLWHLWRTRRQEVMGDISVAGPQWKQLHDFLELLCRM